MLNFTIFVQFTDRQNVTITATFTLNASSLFIVYLMSHVVGTPEVSLTGIKHDIPVQLYQLGQNKYRCVYVPQMPGKIFSLNTQCCLALSIASFLIITS